MYGNLWYGNGGAGIFHHTDGPFAKDQDPVMAAEGERRLSPYRFALDSPFAGLGQTPQESAVTVLTGQLLGNKGLGFATKDGESNPVEMNTPSAWTRMSSGSKFAVVSGAVVVIGGLIYLALRREQRG